MPVGHHFIVTFYCNIAGNTESYSEHAQMCIININNKTLSSWYCAAKLQQRAAL